MNCGEIRLLCDGMGVGIGVAVGEGVDVGDGVGDGAGEGDGPVTVGPEKGLV